MTVVQTTPGYRSMKQAQIINMLSGALLLVVGIGLIIAQMWIEVTIPAHVFDQRGGTIEGMSAKASVHTTYVGLIVIFVGHS